MSDLEVAEKLLGRIETRTVAVVQFLHGLGTPKPAKGYRSCMDPVSYSGAVTGSFTAASVFHNPAYGPVHPASLRLDARVDFGEGPEGSCRYDARLSDGLDAMDGKIRCQIHGPEWVTRSGALSMEKS